MLSYRHAYHAGNHADVLKHGIFTWLFNYLQKKPGGVLVVDTHGGAGLYDLDNPMAQKTGEYADGIGRIWPTGEASVPTLLKPYLDHVADLNTDDGQLRWYPGSSLLAARMRRPQDRVVVFDLHPTDGDALETTLRRKKRVSVQKADGFQGLVALVPPPERRGLVLIDPSYEIKSDYDIAVGTLIRAYRKFSTGVYALWYPVIERERVDRILSTLDASPIERWHQIELCITGDTPGRGMTGSGLIVINPPFTFVETAREGVAWLSRMLSVAENTDT